MKDISIIVPIYQAEKTVCDLYFQIQDILRKMNLNYSIVFINDGSTDFSWNKITELCNNDKNLIGIDLSQNYGQQIAITAGLDTVKSNYYLIMDCDLQDNPSSIKDLYSTIVKEQKDMVLVDRKERKDTFQRKVLSSLFFKLLNYYSLSKSKSSISSFCIFNDKVKNFICANRKSSKFFRHNLQNTSFTKKVIELEHFKRVEGKSTFNFSRLLNIGFDTILANTKQPITLVGFFGIFLFLCSLIFDFLYVKDKNDIYFSIIIKLMSFFFVILNLIFTYLVKIYKDIQNPYLYCIKDEINK